MSKDSICLEATGVPMRFWLRKGRGLGDKCAEWRASARGKGVEQLSQLFIVDSKQLGHLFYARTA